MFSEPAPDEPATEFELEQWAKEAARLIVCTGCYGVGQRQSRASRRDPDVWTTCERCTGTGESMADPAKLRLILEVRQWRRK